ncbi:MAG: fructosamine kinase family protein [Saprospiraceae bacterium]|nr:fructosamine kinase family protein [Lewinella sp.]
MYYLSEVITNKIEAFLGKDIVEVQAVSGGDINEARLISTQDGATYFVKVNSGANSLPLFRTELRGLALLHQHAPKQLYVPRILTAEDAGDAAFLLLEYIQKGMVTPGFWDNFGRGLAELHRATNTRFGLDHSNFIGRLPQSNDPHATWPEFYTRRRLLPQGKLAYENSLFDLKDMQHLERLCKRLGDIYPVESPALIHGDLWNGNYLIHQNGKAVLIDPSVSYSHREMDLAMSRLFGGFPAEFYAAYNEQFALTPGWEERLPIGQLYYLLVHLNMFGTGYLAGVRRIIRQF